MPASNLRRFADVFNTIASQCDISTRGQTIDDQETRILKARAVTEQVYANIRQISASKGDDLGPYPDPVSPEDLIVQLEAEANLYPLPDTAEWKSSIRYQIEGLADHLKGEAKWIAGLVEKDDQLDCLNVLDKTRDLGKRLNTVAVGLRLLKKSA